MVAARDARGRESPGAIERTRCLECKQRKADYPNRDSTKIGSGGGNVDITHKKSTYKPRQQEALLTTQEECFSPNSNTRCKLRVVGSLFLRGCVW